MTAKATHKQKRRLNISAIWIIPLIALLVGLGLMYREWQNRGIPITIEFDNANGLKAGESRLRYRDVNIGTVESIQFSNDKQKVIVGISVDRENKDLLHEDSQIWVVKPRFANGGVSGLNTIISGSYINIVPGTSEKMTRSFTGLENPPITPIGADGIHINLTAIGGNDVSVGDPVIYRGFNVGTVEQVKFSVDERQVQYKLFIDAPYDGLVTTNTIFWQAKGITLSQTTDGIKLDIASIQSLLRGGIEFDTPPGMPLGTLAEDFATYALYYNMEDYHELKEFESFTYIMRVEESIRGLANGAPVEFRGFRIGSVEVPPLTYSPSDSDDESRQYIYVLLKLEPGRVDDEYVMEEFKSVINEAIEDGLYASIETRNLITGAKMISLDFGGDAINSIEYLGDHPVMPARPGKMNQLVVSANSFLENLNELPLEQTVDSANTSLKSLSSILNSSDTMLNEDIATTLNNLNSALSQLSQLLEGANKEDAGSKFGMSLDSLSKTLKSYDDNSRIYEDANAAIGSLRETLDQLGPLLNEMNRKPEMLIFGKGRKQDVEPKASKP